MKTASVADMKARFGDYLKASQHGPVIVTRKGKRVAVLLTVTDEEELERLVLAHSPKFRAIVQKSVQQIQAGKGIPHDEFWRQVEAESQANSAKSKRARSAARC